jgi:hypothetical protein
MVNVLASSMVDLPGLQKIWEMVLSKARKKKQTNSACMCGIENQTNISVLRVLRNYSTIVTFVLPGTGIYNLGKNKHWWCND